MLQKGFLSNKNNFTWSRKRFLWSLFLGAITTASIYTFLCAVRVCWRFVISSTTDWATLLSEQDRYWQNVTFALIAFVMGQSVFLYKLFGKPSFHKISKTLEHRIRNDQFTVSLYFFHWFFRVFILGVLIVGQFSGVKLIDDLNKVLWLSCVVVFLNSWMTIIQAYRKKTYKYMLASGILIAIGSLLIANTSIFNYRKIDLNLLTENPPVDLPVANLSSNRFANVNCSFKIKILLENQNIVYRSYNKNSELENIEPFWEYYNGYRMRGICVFVDKQIPMKVIKRFEFFLYLRGVYRVTYITDSASQFRKTGVTHFLSYTEDEIIKNNSKYNFPKTPPSFIVPPPRFLMDKELIEVIIDNGYFINGELYNKERVLDFFIKNSNSTSVYVFNYKETTTFQDYISLLATYRVAIDDLRVNEMEVFDEFEHRVDGIYDNEAYVEDQKRIKRLYPLQYFDEMTGGI